MNDETAAAIGQRIVSGGVELLRSRLLSEPPVLPLIPKRGDYDLNPQNRPAEKIDLKPAAVLLPLVLRQEAHVLLTQRTHHLTRHAGQVAFPGGRADANDISELHRARRIILEQLSIEQFFLEIVRMLAVLDRRARHTVPFAGPRAEIHHPASFGAEGTVPIGGRGIDRSFANRAAHGSHF